jgi:two-component system, NtrC family, sensor kinase
MPEQPPQTTILFVDNNAVTTHQVDELLSGEGYSVVTCDTGHAALEVLRTNRPDLAIIETMLPDIEGCTIARQIRELVGPDEFLPIILLSALSGETDKSIGLACADDFVTKPFSDTELLARIRVLLRIQRLQREFGESTRRYQFLYENAPHSYISIDRTFRISDCNAAFCSVVGQPKQSVIGRAITDFFLPSDLQAVEQFLGSRTVQTVPGTEPVFDIAVTDKPGHYRSVSLSAAHIGRNEPGVWTVIAMQDVTARSKLEEEQKLARRQLYRSAHLASIGTLASGVAHEINNPLTAILGFSSSLLVRMQRHVEIPPSELLEYLSVINAEAIRCRDIVENLSKFAQERDSQIRDIALHESIDAAVRLIQSRANKRNITITSAVADDVLVRADQGKLTQVFVNLLANSLDFCEDGSSVVIAAAPSSARSGYIRVTVADNGPGIRPEVVSKVFDPFFTTKPVGKGTGLGLSLCHRIMDEFNGSIDIVSETGKGTTVMLELPLTPPV